MKSSNEPNRVFDLNTATKKSGLETRALEILATLNKSLDKRKQELTLSINEEDYSKLYRQTCKLIDLLSTTSTPLLMETAENLERSIDGSLFKIHYAYNELIEEIDSFQLAYHKLENSIPQHRCEESALAQSYLATKKILIVEITDIIQTILRKLITNPCYQLNVCSNQQSALALCQCNHYELVLVDLDVNAVDEVTLCKAIKESSMNSDTPIVATSSFERQAEKSAEFSACEHYVKPVSIDILRECLETYAEDYTD